MVEVDRQLECVSFFLCTVEYKDGMFPSGEVLFTSLGNRVETTFDSDYDGRRSGFTLDVKSIDCSKYSFTDRYDQHSGLGALVL